MQTLDKTALIRALNDRFRNSFVGGRVMLTMGVRTAPDMAKVLAAVKDFTAFDDSNDPHGEHDFVSVDVDGERYFAKIDYYDLKCEYGSEDPADPTKTTRVMTIMHSSEY